MTAILTALHLDDPASLKRALAALLGGLLTLFVNPFLKAKGLPPVDDTALTGFVGIVATFILQSGANSATAKLAEAKAAGDAAGAAVQPGPAADAVVDAAAGRAP